MALQIESIDSGSQYKFGDKLEIPNLPRSLFDLSHTITTTVNNCGKLQILNWILTLPRDDWDIDVDSLLRVMPMVVPPYTKQRQYTYAFWNSLSNLWDNFQVFATKGYSGTVEYHTPKYNDGNLALDTDGLGIQPGSLGDMLGLPQGMTRTQLIGAGVHCLDFMMYLRIWRDYFVNKNYYMNDRIILPDDDSRFRLNNDGELLSAKDQEYTLLIDLWNPATKGIIYDNENKTITVGIFYHEYPKDRFTSAFPSTQRGNEATLPMYISVNSDTKTLFTHSVSGDTNQMNATISHFKNTTSNDSKLTLTAPQSSYYELTQAQINPYNDLFESWLRSHPIASATVNDVRKAFVDQRIMEKMAKTDGSFGEFALTLFGVKPKSAEDYRATYIGGTYKDIAFTEVLQNSPAVEYNDESISTPLGSYAGHGITGQNNNYVGHLKSDDFGICMFMTCVMPDVAYCQGLTKKHSLDIQEDLITPERCKLGMIPLLNQEVFYAGNNGTSVGQDKYIWAYQDYADEYRYEENIISGKIADTNNKSFSPLTQARLFVNLPNWSKDFATADNVRKDYLQSQLEDAFSLMVHFNIRAVRPLPYRSEPATLGI